MIGHATVIAHVAEAMGVDERALLAAEGRQFSDARHLAGWLLTRRCGASSVDAGRALNRDHSVVLYGCKRVDERLANDAIFRSLVRALESGLDAIERWQALVNAEDLLKIATQSARHRWAAVNLSVDQIMAVSEGFLAAWDLARAGETLAAMIVDTDDDKEALAAIAGALIDSMNALRGENQATENDDASHE